MLNRLQLLRRRFWSLIMPVLIGTLAIVLVSILAVHLQQERQGDAILEEITLKSRLVEAFGATEDEYKLELSRAEAHLNTARAIFPLELDERYVFESILSLAESANVYVEISPDGDPVKKKVENIDYSVMSFVLTVQGGYHEVINFVASLDSEQVLLGSLLLERLHIRTVADEATVNLHCEIYALA